MKLIQFLIITVLYILSFGQASFSSEVNIYSHRQPFLINPFFNDLEVFDLKFAFGESYDIYLIIYV